MLSGILDLQKQALQASNFGPGEGSDGVDGEDGGHDKVERETGVLINRTGPPKGLAELVGGGLGAA